MHVRPAVVSDTHLAWVDMEMTGLVPSRDYIIEVAVVITDSDLNVLAQTGSVVIHQPDSIMDHMDEWNTATHQRTGLRERVRQATRTTAQAEQELLAFVRQWLPEGKVPLCGSTVHQDRYFMAHHMPQLAQFFHYRHIDVSTIKELAQRWRPELPRGVCKRGNHQAVEDILESIEELKYYREHFLRLPA